MCHVPYVLLLDVENYSTVNHRISPLGVCLFFGFFAWELIHKEGLSQGGFKILWYLVMFNLQFLHQ